MTTKKQTQDFEKYLEKTLKTIYKKYIKIYGEDNAYLSMFVAKDEINGADTTHYSANNNHWELENNLKLDCYWSDDDEQD